MPFSIEQRGFDDQGLRLQRIATGIDRPDSLFDRLSTDLAQMWRDNIDAGPTERWEAGPSFRALALDGKTLIDSGAMKASIIGRQTGPNEIAVGSDLTVGTGWNLLAIQEFGADVKAGSASWLTFRYPFGLSSDSGWARKQKVHIPRRPTAPFDWDSGELTPTADALTQSRIADYLVELSQ